MDGAGKVKRFFSRGDFIRARLGDTAAERINVLVSYFNILYFFEVMQLMLLLALVAGKAIALFAGALLSGGLTALIIGMYYRKGWSRRIQLILMDVHLPIALVTSVRILVFTPEAAGAAIALSAIRAIMVIGEAALVFLLTDERVIPSFD